MSEISDSLIPIDSLSVDVLTDDVSDNYVSKTLFAVSEFANVVRAGAKMISGETLLCANLGYGLRMVSNAGGVRHTLLSSTSRSDAPMKSRLVLIGRSLDCQRLRRELESCIARSKQRVGDAGAVLGII
jgi:hypothetical protein